MKSLIQYVRQAGVLIVSLLFFSYLLINTTACEKTVEKVVEVHDTTFVNIISVDDVNATPDSIAVGGTITLTADVSLNGAAGDLIYDWKASAGKFDSATGDTVTWHAPDETGSYTITVHVSDGANIGIGSRLVGVGMYAPTVTPYYVSREECAGCHGKASGSSYDIDEAWSLTNHAGAWETLQSSGHAASYCFGCHSVGYEGENGNSGYDEAPIAKFENVQCENCHGPGSDHLASQDKADIDKNYDASVCGTCHDGGYHPFYTEWAASVHGNSLDNHAAGSAYCQGCHEGVAASIRLAGDMSTFYGSGAITDRPDTSEIALSAISCAVCHSPHQADNEHQLRTISDIQLVDAGGVTPSPITEGGNGKLCMQCHHARRSADTQLENGYAYFGPHGSPQADMLAAQSAYLGVADASFNWAAPSHLYIENSCVTCHMNTIPYNGTTAVTGHSYEPTVEACAKCHGTINDFADIMARDDFDGDGTVEGVQTEVTGLITLLETALVSAGLDTTGGVSIAHALGDTLRSTLQLRKAGYDLAFVLDDKSLGVHNPDYTVQILQQSYKFLTGAIPRGAVEADGLQKVATIW